ncbi:hypothetical protein [Streptomyces chattanoogensis]|uniref:hypothetical protein n=1 Tax=Streptomyces chattanoogensis TaxID=66876 RepID=UPI0036D12EA6
MPEMWLNLCALREVNPGAALYGARSFDAQGAQDITGKSGGRVLPDINVEPKSLRAAADHGEEMYAGMGIAISDLSAHHQGVPGQTDGLGFAAELMKVHRAWHDRLNDVGKECGSIAVGLKVIADTYEKNEEATTQSFNRSPAQSAHHASPFG